MAETNPGSEDGVIDYPVVSRTPVAIADPPSPRWIAPTALVISLLAAAAAGWSLFKPAPQPPEASPAVFSGPKADNPKEVACQATALVANGVLRQSTMEIGPEPAALEAVAANTRLAMAGGAAYLRDTVPVNTPPELAEPIAALARQLQDGAQYFLVGETSNQPDQGARLKAATESTKRVADLCK